MAARKGRAEKKVLSRQEISTRKRALSEKKLASQSAGKRAIVGTLLLTVSSLLALSFLTFDVRDRVGPRGFHNAVGPVGHLLAETFKGMFGVCALVLPAAGFYAAAILFVGDSEKRRWPQLVSALLLTLSGAVLAQLCFGDQPGWAHPPGGSVGAFLAEIMSGLFSTVGTVILVTAVSIVALIVGTQFVFLRLCAMGWVGAQEVGHQATVLSALLWEKAQVAYHQHRNDSAKAKEEEAAFLAQLEADEEELMAAEGELEAQEAEAIAEEAMRLAKEAQERRKKEAKDAKLSAKVGTRLSIEDSAGAASIDRAAMEAPVAAASAASKREKKQPALITPAQTPNVDNAVSAQSTLAATDVLPPIKAPVPASNASALARTPVIIEPKAPPKPTGPSDAFEFVGDRKSFTLPPIDVLSAEKHERTVLDKEAFLSTAEKLRAKLADFGIDGEVVEIRPGPVVTMYEFLPGPGIKVSKIASLSDDLAMAMEAMRVRIVAPIPGKGVVGIEVPNKDRETVYLRDIAEQDAFTKSASKLTMCVGKDIEGMPYVLDLGKAPHILIAGTTGSGKSVAVNSMIMSILLKSTPEEVRFIMVDPKMLELSVYEGIPHLLLPVVTDPKKAALALRWAVEEMERRYQMLAEAGVRNLAGFNKLVETQQGMRAAAAPAAKKRKMRVVDVAPGENPDDALSRAEASGAMEMGVPSPKEAPEEVREANSVSAEALPELPPTPQEAAALAAAEDAAKDSEDKKKELKKLPYIVVIIDELADLMMVASREVETFVARLAQMARAAGIHLMVATQRPSTDVVTGIIKANFPTRISFMLRSKPDSMTILGTVGAEALLGMGDMLIMPPTSAHLQRVHGAYVSETEIKAAVDHLKAQGKPVFDESILKPREEDNEGGGEEDELSDELYDQALATVSEMRTVSISMLQRKMRIGYNRAARMIERMERDGVVGGADGAKPREVLIRPLGEMPGAGAM